jgi:Papain-like cysteine protease AvrRpt2
MEELSPLVQPWTHRRQAPRLAKCRGLACFGWPFRMVPMPAGGSRRIDWWGRRPAHRQALVAVNRGEPPMLTIRSCQMTRITVMVAGVTCLLLAACRQRSAADNERVDTTSRAIGTAPGANKVLDLGPMTTAAGFRQLRIPYHFQQAHNWCGPASAEMIAHALTGEDRLQFQQCNQLIANRFPNLPCCADTTACDAAIWPPFHSLGFTFVDTTSDSGLSPATIRAEIEAKRPIAFSWYWLNAFGHRETVGHMMVLTGYQPSTDEVVVLDPRPGIGEQRFSHAYYVSGADHQHWDDFFGITIAGPQIVQNGTIAP